MTDEKLPRQKLPWRRKFVEQLLDRDELADRLLSDDPPASEEENVAYEDRSGIDSESTETDDFPDLDGWEDVEESGKNDWSAADAQLDDYLDDQEAFERRAFEQFGEAAGKQSVANWIRYRWEFMRRSRDYQDAYRRHRENPKAEMDVPERLRKFEWWQSFGLFCSEPPDPNLTFEELMDDERYRLLDDPLFRLGVISRNDRTESAVSFFTYREESVDFQKFDRLRLDVDLPRVRDIRTLTRMITRIVEDHWQHYERRHRRRKAHPDEHDYDLLLKIGDMKDGQGMNYRQIAEQIFPQDSHPKSARRRAAKYYRIYRKLIGGGYKQLALP